MGSLGGADSKLGLPRDPGVLGLQWAAKDAATGAARSWAGAARSGRRRGDGCKHLVLLARGVVARVLWDLSTRFAV